MQLWPISDLFGSLMILLTVQVIVAVAFIVSVLFPLMGRIAAESRDIDETIPTVFRISKF